MLLGEVIHGDYNTWVGPTKGLLHSGTNYQVKHWSNTGQYNIYIYIYIYNILVGRAHQGPAALGHQLPGQIPVEYWLKSKGGRIASRGRLKGGHGADGQKTV